MAEKTEKNPQGAGRPLFQIDWELVDELCRIQCTLREITEFLKCDKNTLHDATIREHGVEFSRYYEQKRGSGKVSLRRALWRRAVDDGDKTMLIWLSKNYLDMADRIDQRQATTVEGTVAVVPAMTREQAIRILQSRTDKALEVTASEGEKGNAEGREGAA